jgi:RNA polymerase sigma factor FliA
LENREGIGAAVWREYRRTGDLAIRDRLIEAYAPLVEQVVDKMRAEFPIRVDPHDLLDSGLFGLLGALERFDPDFYGSFEAVAIRRIEGAIIDELRDPPEEP